MTVDEKKAGLAWQAGVAPPADHRRSGVRPSAVVCWGYHISLLNPSYVPSPLESTLSAMSRWSVLWDQAREGRAQERAFLRPHAMNPPPPPAPAVSTISTLEGSI